MEKFLAEGGVLTPEERSRLVASGFDVPDEGSTAPPPGGQPQPQESVAKSEPASEPAPDVAREGEVSDDIPAGILGVGESVRH